jgi:uncharacterized protein YwqG
MEATMTTGRPAEVLQELRDRLHEMASEHLGAAGRLVEELARPAARLVHDEDAAGSRLGGEAVLEPGMAWPSWGDQPLALVAVVDLAQLQDLVVDVSLPRSGLLNFFYEVEDQQAWGFDPSHRDGWRVLLSRAGAGERRAAPEGTAVFDVAGLRAEQTLTVPGWEEPALAEALPPDADRVGDLLDAWAAHIGLYQDPCHQVGGWPRLQQAPFWRECAAASRGLPVGTQEEWQAAEARLGPSAEPWRLLLQLDTDDDVGWMWGDVGSLYYALPQDERLSAPDVEAWMVLQCG